MRLKNTIVLLTVSLMFLCGNAFAESPMDEADGYKLALPGVEKYDKQSYKLLKSEVGEINKTLGVVAFEEGEEIVFTVGTDGDQVKGVLLSLTENGKMGLIEVMVSMEVNPVKVLKVLIISTQESRGRGIIRKEFRDQYIGKSLKDPLLINEDIKGVTRATTSSWAVNRAVKKSLLLVEDVYNKRAH